MLSIEQIRNAHANVKSGADFPAYIRELKALGVKSYDVYVADGRSVYAHVDGLLDSGPKYDALPVAATGNASALANALKIHQQGSTDYPTFCRQAAEAGVDKWQVAMDAMTCSYSDRSGAVLVVETIPVP